MDDCFIHGCVFCYWICRSDVSVISSRMCLFLNYSFWPCHYGFLTLLVGDKFSSQMVSRTVIWLLGLDRIFKRSYAYLVARPRSWKELVSCEFRW